MLSHIYQNRSFLKNDEDQMLANCRETESLLHCRQECKKVLSLWKTVWQLLKLKKKKTKHTTDIWPRSCTPGCLSQINKMNGDLYWLKPVHKCLQKIYSNIPKLSTIQMFFSGWMVKQIMVDLPTLWNTIT